MLKSKLFYLHVKKSAKKSISDYNILHCEKEGEKSITLDHLGNTKNNEKWSAWNWTQKAFSPIEINWILQGNLNRVTLSKRNYPSTWGKCFSKPFLCYLTENWIIFPSNRATSKKMITKYWVSSEINTNFFV